jgi:protein PhnA
MSEENYPCPSCACDYAYPLDNVWVCPECTFEWDPKSEEFAAASDEIIVKDSLGNLLKNGDSVQIIKDLPVKGASKSIKVGTKVTNIKLVNGDHNIDCKIPGFGAMGLKSEFVKKI